MSIILICSPDGFLLTFFPPFSFPTVDCHLFCFIFERSGGEQRLCRDNKAWNLIKGEVGAVGERAVKLIAMRRIVGFRIAGYLIKGMLRFYSWAIKFLFPKKFKFSNLTHNFKCCPHTLRKHLLGFVLLYIILWHPILCSLMIINMAFQQSFTFDFNFAKIALFTLRIDRMHSQGFKSLESCSTFAAGEWSEVRVCSLVTD